MSRNAIVVIDHEPKSHKKQSERQTAPSVELNSSFEPMAAVHTPQQTQSSNGQSEIVFGKRQKSAVTDHFFNQSLTQKANKSFNSERSALSRSYTQSSIFNELPVKSLAAVFAIALLVPLTFIALSEGYKNEVIDPITTASIRSNSPISINDISMTKVLKGGTSVISVFGKITNTSNAKKQIGEVTITLRDKDGHQLQTWKHKTGIETLDKGKSLRFITSAIDVKGTGNSVSVSAKSSN